MILRTTKKAVIDILAQTEHTLCATECRFKVQELKTGGICMLVVRCEAHAVCALVDLLKDSEP